MVAGFSQRRRKHIMRCVRTWLPIALPYYIEGRKGLLGKDIGNGGKFG